MSGDAEFYYNRGVTYLVKGQYDLAISDLTKALEINPNLAEAYCNRGNAYSLKGQFDLAISDYTKALETNPNLAEAYYNRGQASHTAAKKKLRSLGYEIPAIAA